MDWTPPTDAVEEKQQSFTPPSDAISEDDLKKKSLKEPITPSSSGSEVSAYAPPSISRIDEIKNQRLAESNAKKTDFIKNQMAKDLTSNPTKAYKDNYVNYLSQKGYDKNELQKFADSVVDTRTQKEKDDELNSQIELGSAESLGRPVVNFIKERGQQVAEGGKKLAEGVANVSGALGAPQISTNEPLYKQVEKFRKEQEKVPEARALDVVKGVAKMGAGGAEMAFNIIPQAVAFTAGTEAIKNTANKTLGEDNWLSKAVDVPFSMATSTAKALGYSPDKDSFGSDVLGIADLFLAAGAHKYGSKAIASTVEGYKKAMKLGADGELPAYELENLQDYTESLKNVTLDDIAQEAIRQGKAQVAQKIEDAKPIEQLHDEASQLQSDLEKKPELAPIIIPKLDIFNKKIEQKEGQQVASHLADTKTLADISDLESKKEEVTPATQKLIDEDIINKQNTLSDDTKSQQREIPSEKQIRQESIEEKPIEETSGEKTSPSGVLQEQEVKTRKSDDYIRTSFQDYANDKNEIPYDKVVEKTEQKSSNFKGENPIDLAKRLEDNGFKVTDKPEAKVEPSEKEMPKVDYQEDKENGIIRVFDNNTDKELAMVFIENGDVYVLPVKNGAKIAKFKSLEDAKREIERQVPDIKPKSETKVSGKEIEPHKEVSASQKSAVDEVVNNFHKDLKPMEATMLFSETKGDNHERFLEEGGTELIPIKEEGLKGKIFKKLEEKGYVTEFNSEEYALTPKGKEFVDRVKSRLETRKGVKEGIDLFPEDANIPEFKAINKHIENGTITKEQSEQYINGEPKEEHEQLIQDAESKTENIEGTSTEELKAAEEQLNGAINGETPSVSNNRVETPLAITKEALNKEFEKVTGQVIPHDEQHQEALATLGALAEHNGTTIREEAQNFTDNTYNTVFDEKGKQKTDPITKQPVRFNPTFVERIMVGINYLSLVKRLADLRFNGEENTIEAKRLGKQLENNVALQRHMYSESGRSLSAQNTMFNMSPEGDIELKYNQIAREHKFNFKMPSNKEEFDALTPQQQKIVKPIYDAFEKYKADTKANYEKELENANKIAQEEFDRKLEQELKKGTSKPAPKQSTKEQGKDLADLVRKAKIDLSKLSGGGVQSNFAGIPVGIYNAIVETVAKLIEGGATLTDAIKQAVSEHKVDVDVKELEDSIIGSAKKVQSKENALSDLEKYAKENKITNITKDLSNEGLVDKVIKSYLGDIPTKDILKTALDDIKKILPDATISEVRDSYIKKGDYERPTEAKTKSDIQKAQTELDNIAGLQRKIEVLEKGLEVSKAEKPTVARSEYEKELQKQLDDLKAEKRAKAEEKRKYEAELAKAGKEITDSLNKQKKSEIKKAQDELDKRIDKEIKDTEKLEAKKKADELKRIEKEKQAELKKITDELEKEYKQKNKTELEKLQDELDKKVEKIAEYEQKIKDVEEKKKLWDKTIRNKNPIDQELQKVKDRLKQAMDRQGLSKDVTSQFAKDKKAEVIKSHNKKVDDLMQGLRDSLNDVKTKDEANAIYDKIAELNKLKINETDVEKIDDKIMKANKVLDDLLKKDPTNKDLQNIKFALNNENIKANEAIKLNRSIEALKSSKAKSERDLAAGKFEENKTDYDLKQSAEYNRANIAKKKAERIFEQAKKDYDENHLPQFKKWLNAIPRGQTVRLISGIKSFARIGGSTMFKPSADISARQIGKLSPSAIFNKLAGIKLNTERETPNLKTELRAFRESLTGFNEKQAKAKIESTKKNLDNAIQSVSDATDKLNSLKRGSKEYSDFLHSDEYNQALNDFNNAKAEANKLLAYEFLGGDEMDTVEAMKAWKNRLDILKKGSTAFEESMGGYLRQGRKSSSKWDTFKYITDGFGRSHAAIKDLSARQAFLEHWYKGVDKLTDGGKNELNPDDAAVLMNNAYEKSFLGGKFQGENGFAKWIRSTQHEWDKKGGGYVAASFALKMLTPVLRIPANIYKEGHFKYSLGAPFATAKFFNEVYKYDKSLSPEQKEGLKGLSGFMEKLRGTAENLPPDVADHITELRNKGFTGAAVGFALGTYLANNGLGYDEKKHTITWDDEPINNVANGILLHTPFFVPFLLATIFHQVKKDDSESGTYNTMSALSKTFKHVYEESPIKPVLEVDPRKLWNQFTTIAFTKDIAEMIDSNEDGKVQREVDTDENFLKQIWDNLKLTTGIGRQTVPEK